MLESLASLEFSYDLAEVFFISVIYSVNAIFKVAGALEDLPLPLPPLNDGVSDVKVVDYGDGANVVDVFVEGVNYCLLNGDSAALLARSGLSKLISCKGHRSLFFE